ncbi:MAG TPA: hypothetical protein V6D19_12930 [Stenomitos sp.]
MKTFIITIVAGAVLLASVAVHAEGVIKKGGHFFTQLDNPSQTIIYKVFDENTGVYCYVAYQSISCVK